MKTNGLVITQSDLLMFLEKLVKKTRVIAPVKNEFDDLFLLPVDSAKEIQLDYENTINTAKEYFFPDSEYLFTFTGGRYSSIQLPILEGDFVLFGVRACDTRAINLFDRFFERNFQDEPYFQRRLASTVITLVCSEIWDGCFCSSVGDGPVLTGGFDIQLTPVQDKFFVQIGSEKGQTILEGFKKFFNQADEGDKNEFPKMKDRLKKQKVKFNPDSIYENLKNNRVDSSLWQDIASRCQSCGLCLYICPTCSCFTVNDRQKATGSQGRLRQWDTCYFRGFTRMAGNQDPIANKQEMVKRKYTHKLWQQIDEFGIAGCTGCGRCNKSCVGNINWLENLIKIEKG